MLLRAVVLLVALAGHHGASTVDRNTAFIGYSESSDGGGGGGGAAAGGQGGGGGCTSQDDNEGCGEWAIAGECAKNPGYMRVSCAHSCKIPCVAPLRRSASGSSGGGVLVMHTSEVGLYKLTHSLKAPDFNP